MIKKIMDKGISEEIAREIYTEFECICPNLIEPIKTDYSF